MSLQNLTHPEEIERMQRMNTVRGYVRAFRKQLPAMSMRQVEACLAELDEMVEEMGR